MIGMHFNDPEKGVADTDWVRLWDCGVTWKDIHLEPGVYDWSRLDWLVDLYSDRNIVYVIAATPRWLATDPDAPHFAPWLGPGTNSLPSDSDIDEFNTFVWHLTMRYKGRIKAYEIWNEPQLPDFMYPYNRKNRNRLAQMTKRAYRTIKRISPDTMVLSASVLPRKSSGGMRRANRFLRALKKKGWPVDRITCHIYPEVDEGSIKWAMYLADVRKSARKFGGPQLIWVTETNYNLLGDVIDGKKAEQYVKSTYEMAGNSPIFWYGWNKMDVLGGLNINHDSAAWKEMQKHKDS
jgi:hypothetical protein